MATTLADMVQIAPFYGSSRKDLNVFIRSIKDGYNMTEETTKSGNKGILDKKKDATFDKRVDEFKKGFALSVMDGRHRKQLRSRRLRLKNLTNL
ncbi:hypothetical protein GCK72_008514 [Caenorhabditis remanei]|uniref:Uncharacterized protein n=1 Tax=Caenorhabditis remanei TaxID=31234 RepID=A0A6A5GXS8_CAERE|nr:hypothetical protein GCK72_008514 [Caenorhabditis remanei]KAF1760268.1 hypothetical protein GCK72_008514 [Caenorhabditis remanei]